MTLVGPLLTFVAAATAWADHPRLDEATRLIGEANFEDAMDALEEVAEAESLSRAEVVRLLVLRSLVHHALGNGRALDDELAALASLEPGHSFAANVPPSVQSRFEQLRGRQERPLELEVLARRIRGGFQIDARVEGDEGGLVETTRIFARLPGGEWVETEGRTASIPVRGDSAVEYYVVAIGPGGSQLLREGSEASPRLIGTPGSGELTDEPTDGGTTNGTVDDDEEEGGRRAWPWALLATGLTVVIVGAVVAAVVVTRQNQGTQLDAPDVDWP